MSGGLLIGWTTCGDVDIAERLANEIVERDLAACVQIDPIRSFFRWEGSLEDRSEYRLTLKFMAKQSKAIEGFLHANHPYETPQWVVVEAQHVSPKYLDWVSGS